MSLNWREIDRILEELPLEGSLVQEVHQPSHPRLVLELYNRGHSYRLLFCFAGPYCRLHLLSRRLPNPAKPPRFVSFLRARVRGGRVVSARQLDGQRIVRLQVNKAGETVLLWARLWSGAGNLVATDSEGTVLDALYRRPRRGEVSGGRYTPERELEAALHGAPQGAAAASPAGNAPAAARSPQEFIPREFPGPGSYNERVERHYEELESRRAAERLQQSLLAGLERRENHILASLEALGTQRGRQGDPELLRKCGDMILSSLHTLSKGSRWLEAPDPESGESLGIELDPHLEPAENAAAYYRRYRKARAGLQHVEEQTEALRDELARALQKIEALKRGEADLAALQREMRRARRPGPEPAADGAGALRFASGPFAILVGRTARENERLLRQVVKGNDLWLHARDHPGAYVFIRALPGKSVPLESLVDAATLALLYSRGKASGRGDVYYTKVKYLRRPRQGKPGLVIPTQERNLHVLLEEARVQRLMATRGASY